MFWTGVGSRSTPDVILVAMTKFADHLNQAELTLRSGGAKGADTAFEKGSRKKEIFYTDHWEDSGKKHAYNATLFSDAMQIASEIHPAWGKCGDFAKKLHARNCFQVLGASLDPEEASEFLACWTPRGEKVGGTRTAIMLAEKHGVEVVNFATDEGLGRGAELIARYLI